MAAKVALITAYGLAGVSAPLNNALIFLTSRGKECDLYYEYQAGSIHEPRLLSPLQRNIRNRFQLLRNPLWRLVTLLGGLDFYHHRHSLGFSLFQLWKARYQFSIGYDPEGAIRAYFLWKRLGTPYLVHSLELSERDGLSALEKKAFANARAVLTTDTRRGDIVARLYDLPADKVIPLPNSSIGRFDGTKSRYFRDKFGIADEDLIVLCTGTLGPEHCVDLIIEGVLQWPEGFVLVLHGWLLPRDLRERVGAINALKPGKIFISEELLPYEQKATVFRAADIGIVAFSPDSFNHVNGAGSAGKLYDCCQAGVPILANDIPDMREIVEGNHIGLVIPSFLEAGSALASIKSTHKNYGSACEQFFTSHEFSHCFAAILSRLNLL